MVDYTLGAACQASGAICCANVHGTSIQAERTWASPRGHREDLRCIYRRWLTTFESPNLRKQKERVVRTDSEAGAFAAQPVAVTMQRFAEYTLGLLTLGR